MSAYYKREENGSISTGINIYGPGWMLNENTTNESYDGWKWFNTPEEAYAAFAIGEGNVTPRQIRLALLQHNIDLALINAAVSSSPSAAVEWEYASYINRNHPLVEHLGAQLGLASEQIDAIFQLAITL